MAQSTKRIHPAALWVLRLSLPLLILAGGIAAYNHILNSREKPKRIPRIPQLQVVEAQALKLSSYTVPLRSQGTVRPAAQAQLSAEVSGRVIWVNPNFREGNQLSKGEELLHLEQADYQAEVILAQSQLASANASLEEEQARADRAQSEWKRLRGDALAPPLAIREPQLKQAKAALQAAQASLSQAERNLERTIVRAPWDAYVRAQSVDEGQFVNRGELVGELFQADKTEVWLPLTQLQLAHLDQSRIGGKTPLPVQLTTQEQGIRQSSTGYAMRLLAELDEETRQQFLIVEITKDTAAQTSNDKLQQEQASTPLLPVNAFVKAQFEGITLNNVFVLQPIAVRESLEQTASLPPGAQAGKIYLVEEEEVEEKASQKEVIKDAKESAQNTQSQKQGRLYSRQVAILWRTKNAVIVQAQPSAEVSQAVQEGDLICLTNLQRIPEGQPVRIREPKSQSSNY